MSSTTFIISAARPEYGLSNAARTVRLRNMLESLNVTVLGVWGFYKGASERSLMVVPNEHSAESVRNVVLKLAKEFKQESVLEINKTGHSWLVRPDGTQEFLGKMIQVDSVNPKKVTGFTQLGNGTYLALEHEVNGDE